MEFGLKINCSRTRLMIADRTHDNTPEVNCRVAPSYIYFGALISNEGGCVDEIKLPVAITRSAMDKMRKIWRNRNITKAHQTPFILHYTGPQFNFVRELIAAKR